MNKKVSIHKKITRTSKQQSMFQDGKIVTQTSLLSERLKELQSTRMKHYEKLIHEIRGKNVNDKKELVESYDEKVKEIDIEIRSIYKKL
jgi:hypothetical protein